MRRIPLWFIPVIAQLALMPLPALAGGEGPKASGVPKHTDPSYRGFKTAEAYFAIFLRSGGSLIVAPAEYIGENSMTMGSPETEAERAQRKFVEWVVKERKRKEDERQTREAEQERKAAENRSEDDLPGLDY